MFSQQDEQFMRQALALAWQGRFSTSPNPKVGCVIAQGEQVVGQGFHLRAGEPHAEVHAIRQAGQWTKGATVYVTLEPCAHYGRTPPCAEGLIAAGVKRVIIAMYDPNPLVSGKGVALLRNAGIEVQVGLFESEAHQLNRGFLSRIERQRPFAFAKLATSLDGKTALSDGRSQWITGASARYDVQKLRAQSCAILTGIGTVLTDNPRLNVREIQTLRQPTRIVLDRHFRLPQQARLIQDGGATWVFTHKPTPDWVKNYPHLRLFPYPDGLSELWHRLAQENVGELMVEAGATLTSALLQEDLLDELVLYQAPKILGGTGHGAFILPEISVALSQDSIWKTHTLETIGEDIKWVLQKR